MLKIISSTPNKLPPLTQIMCEICYYKAYRHQPTPNIQLRTPYQTPHPTHLPSPSLQRQPHTQTRTHAPPPRIRRVAFTESHHQWQANPPYPPPQQENRDNNDLRMKRQKIYQRNQMYCESRRLKRNRKTVSRVVNRVLNCKRIAESSSQNHMIHVPFITQMNTRSSL
ncbi:hypothetical protein E6O75_ATG10463 [Venturia nashicola]|uniref:Uncharacterized protein n=1 Tax=Venturia nashicola TaxID=86259 RepID=A0A4Z1NSI0_9PEZI|nr:hypothetical protein E6O75_ATG10463 [Venturia nashicola]